MAANKKLFSSGLAIFAVVLLLQASGYGQACPAPNWTTGPTVWAAEDSIKVVQENDPASNQPTIPVYVNAGQFDPQGYPLHPQPLTQLNPVWSCPAGTPVISVQGAGRETVAFQLLITAGASAALGNVSVNISPLTGPGAAITSDNTQGSAITRYLEGYIPESYPGPGNGVILPVSGNFPDPLLPFYDPYDAGNGPVATPFNVAAATTQGVWVDIAIPYNQTAGTYTGSVTVTGNGIGGTVTYPVTLTVWNGNLPRFNDPSNPDMLKAWIPLYGGELQDAEGMNCLYDPNLKATVAACPDWTVVHEYQTMAHNYDFDTQVDGVGPTLTPVAGAAAAPPYPTAITSIDWTNYDLMNGPAMTPGGLFADGSSMRVIDAPFSGGGGPWNDGFYEYGPDAWNNYGYSIDTLPPPGLLQLFTSYSTQISQHFTSNQQNKGWTPNSEIIAYTVDETYDKLQQSSDLNTVIEQYAQALNQANATNKWVNPLRFFLTAPPGCIPGATEGVETGAICTAWEGLSYPALGSTPNDWIEDWSPDGGFYEPGPSTDTPDYTMDGVAANSTAPVPIEKWFYGGGDPFTPNIAINDDALGLRTLFWIAAKYGLDQTVPSPGDPNPVPTPGGVFNFAANYWAVGDTGNPSTASDCSTSPFFNGAGGQGWDGNGYYFYPGNEVGCYYQSNSLGTPVGATVLTANPVANANCSTTDFSICNGISGPVTSMTMEEWRRGYQDYMYIYLLRKKNSAQATAIVDSMGGGGLQNWNALNWENADPNYLITGVFPPDGGYGNGFKCTAPSLGLINGPTGAYGCPGEWSHNPNHYEEARITMAEDLGFVSAAALPTVTSISPSSGPAAGGTSVIITGTGFTNATVVNFGSGVVPSFTVNSATQITVVSPAGNGTVDVTVSTPAGVSVTSAADQFVYPAAVVASPTVTAISPATGSVAGGTSVTITGTNFTGATAVNFGSAAVASLTVNSSTQITAVSPAGSSGTVDVTVVTPGGTSATNASDQFVYTPGSYTIAANPTTVTVQAGKTGTATVTVTPTGGYTGSVTLSCDNLPANTECVFSQSGGGTNTVMMNGSNQAVPVTLTIQTNVLQAAMTPGQQSPLSPILPALAFWFPGGLAGFAAFRRSKKKGPTRGHPILPGIVLLVLMAGAMAAGLAGCGGSHSPTTPAGTTTVTVTSTAPAGSSGLSQSANFTLTITQ